MRERLDRADQADDRELKNVASPEQLSFDWVNDWYVFTGSREVFRGNSGPTFPLSDLKNSLDIFLKIWDDPIIDLIVKETNRYADMELTRMGKLKENSRFLTWKETDKNEIMNFFAIMIFHGLAPVTVEKDYFKLSGTFAMPGLASLMPYNRFIQLKRFLHFNDATMMPNDTNLDQKQLYNINPIIYHLRQKFMTLYMPGQSIVLDESLLNWSGRLTFSQKISNKASKVGIKSYELCDSATGYIWNFFIYGGAKKAKSQGQAVSVIEPDGTTAKIVFKLVDPLLGKGHTLVVDNLCNSPLLARCLKAQKTDVLGTLRVSREFVPESIKSLSKSAMRVGDVFCSQTYDLTVLLWRDASLIAILSTYHPEEFRVEDKHDNSRYKPQAVLDYKQLMGGVDKKKKLLSATPIERTRNHDWYKKLFRRLLNVSILNSYIVYKCKESNITQRNFRNELAEMLIATFRQEPVPVRTLAVVQNRPKLSGNHFIMKGRTRHALCVLCRMNGTTKRTVYKCEQCGVSLCLDICFKEYHTDTNVHFNI